MYRNVKYFFAMLCAVLTALLLSSCASGYPEALTKPQSPENTPRMEKRAEQFQDFVSSKCTVSMVIDNKTQSFYQQHPGRLAARIKSLGVKEIYLEVNPKELASFRSESAPFVRAMLRSAHAIGLKAYAMFDCTDLIQPRQDGWFGSSSPAAARAKEIVSFNRGGDDGERFDGLLPLIAPWSVSEESHHHLFHWKPGTFGGGGENDIMLDRSLLMLAEIRKVCGNMALSAYTAEFCHDKSSARELSHGKVADFLAAADFVVIGELNNDFTMILEAVSTELEEESKENSISIRLLCMDSHYSDKAKATSIASGNWISMVKTLNSVVKGAGRHKSFRGILIDNYSGFEAVWERGH